MTATRLNSLQQMLRIQAKVLFPGVIVSVMVAATAQFLAEHYDTPAMLLALLLGIAVSFLGEEGKTVEGVGFAAKSFLRLGVALLGVRVSMMQIADLGPQLIALIVLGVLSTIGFGLLVARYFGHRWQFALLTAGAVAICGASAAMAIGAILPRNPRSEEHLIFTVMGVTLLSTLAMILYPILAGLLAFSDVQAGVFIGGTIHDVAQVVGAGFSISDEAGATATLVKLIRVAMLAPIVLTASLLIRNFANVQHIDGKRPPILPGFVIAFACLALLNSTGLLPTALVTGLSGLSRWLLLIAIAAVGMKSNLKQVLSVGGAAIALILIETLFIGMVFLIGVEWLT